MRIVNRMDVLRY